MRKFVEMEKNLFDEFDPVSETVFTVLYYNIAWLVIAYPLNFFPTKQNERFWTELERPSNFLPSTDWHIWPPLDFKTILQ